MTQTANPSIEIILAQSPFFSAFPNAALSKLSRAVSMQALRRGRFLYKPEEAAKGLYLVLNGRIKLAVIEDGREQIKAIVRPGQLFGENGLTGQTFRTEHALAMDRQVDVLFVPSEALIEVMLQWPEVQMLVLNHVGQQLRLAQERLEALVFQDARSRIISFLREGAKNYGVKVGFEILLRQFPTHREVASLTDTSRQTVTMVLSELRRKKVIHVDRNNLLIRDMTALG